MADCTSIPIRFMRSESSKLSNKLEVSSLRVCASSAVTGPVRPTSGNTPMLDQVESIRS